MNHGGIDLDELKHLRRGNGATSDEAFGGTVDGDLADSQRVLYERLLEVHATKGLLVNGTAPALCWPSKDGACPHAPACWAKGPAPPQEGIQNGERDAVPDGENGSTYLPWVGPRYQPGPAGIVLVGNNHHHTHDRGKSGEGWWAPVTQEAVLSAELRKRLRERRVKVHGSMFSFRAVDTALLVRRLDADPQDDGREGHHAEVAQELDRVARLQAVKCTPTDTKNGKPYPAMSERCPSFLLEPELAVLAPATVVAFGDARSAVGRLFRPEIEHRDGRALDVGTATEVLPGARVIGLRHPTARGRSPWLPAREALVRYLRGRP